MNSAPLRVFWQPGCSSCVKVKEFLDDQQISYESVNILSDPAAIDEVRRLGAIGIPIVSRGDDYVYAQSLDDVAAFVGGRPPSVSLSAAQLIERWVYFLDIAKSFTRAMLPEHLSFRPLPVRDRDLRKLAYHVFQIPDVFLSSVEDGFEGVLASFHAPMPVSFRAGADILEYADRVTSRLETWWGNLGDKTCHWEVKTDYAVQPALQFLERSTWHSAQHTRQLQAALDGLGVTLPRRINSELYVGLPMPKEIWE